MASIGVRPQLRVLASREELREAELRRKALGVCPSPDPYKVWDNLLAVETLTSLGRPNVLDVGCRSGILLPWLTQLGFRDVWGVDTRLPLPPIKTAITNGQLGTLRASLTHLFKHWGHLRRAPAEALPFQDNQFAALACMSVIEHGIDVSRFIQEAYRVLAPGGFLVMSTDYWHEPVIRTSTLFGKSDMVFDRPQIEAMLRMASTIGFTTPTLPAEGVEPSPVVHFGGLQYTFLFMVLAKSPTSASRSS